MIDSVTSAYLNLTVRVLSIMSVSTFVIQSLCIDLRCSLLTIFFLLLFDLFFNLFSFVFAENSLLTICQIFVIVYVLIAKLFCVALQEFTKSMTLIF